MSTEARQAGDTFARALARGAEFVSRHGDGLARTRLGILLHAASPSSIETALAPWQCRDGGFAPLASLPGASARATVMGTLSALDLYDEAGLRSGAALSAAVAWLGRMQTPDGAWHPTAGERLAGGDEDPVFLTGLLAGHLSKLRWGSARTLAQAEAFLAARWSPERVEGGGWRGLSAYAHACSNGCAELADEALQWCGRALEKGYRSGGLGVLEVARVLLLCDAHSLPGGHVDAGEVVLALLAAQQPDGALGEPGLPTASRVEATLVGARTWVRFAPVLRAAAPSVRAR
jgi:hypothetical protein